MSGICGIYNLDGKPLPAETLDGMMATLSHRGPDGSGSWRDGPVGLGHLMLHSTPESLDETLPLKDASGDLVITADARIDNREELFNVFGIPRPERAGIPDSTIILKAYEKWGEDCPTHLLGDFAFAVWDKKKQQLFCARDQIGIKAFYYHHSPRFFAFASEIKGVLAVPDVPRRLNEIAVADYLVYNEQDLEITFYEEILRLPPAHVLVLRGGESKIVRYWAPQLGPELKLSSDEEYAEALREQMFQAVYCRMRSAFPVGVTLSGGLDSSSVACIAARALRKNGERLIAVSSVLPKNHSGTEKDEREYIEEVLRQEENIDIEYVLAEGATPFDDLEGQFRRMDQPFRDGFYYMTDALFSAAKKHKVRTLLSGFGGDITASFNGKGYMAQLARTGHWFKLARLLRQCSAMEKKSPWAVLKGEVLGVLAPLFALRLYHRLKRRQVDGNWISSTAIHPSFARRIGILERCHQGGHGLHDYRIVPNSKKMMLWGVGTPILTFSLESYAASQTAFGLEHLHPFLDRKIIDFCLTIPPALFLKNGRRRNLIRHAMKGVLPPHVQRRTTKHPFTPDYHRRMLNARPRMLRFLSQIDAEYRHSPYVDRTKIEQQLRLLKPCRRWDEWETKTQIIVGKGLIVERFHQWFSRTG